MINERSAQIFKISRRHLKILEAIVVT